ncbi:hypothetical protein GALMADRAFT_933749 [Galerina marginata CBS 339.88]|uniref:Uncharacterized protein n=1 Tax=Galerina marginata (strain CBS 339.88) TaxID=685588 RepID=A0A067SDR1_GALM3|nr:hypothetical protein GALMADRAFT_933749 [Galerina marginata CBS 339.88]
MHHAADVDAAAAAPPWRTVLASRITCILHTFPRNLRPPRHRHRHRHQNPPNRIRFIQKPNPPPPTRQNGRSPSPSLSSSSSFPSRPSRGSSRMKSAEQLCWCTTLMRLLLLFPPPARQTLTAEMVPSAAPCLPRSPRCSYEPQKREETMLNPADADTVRATTATSATLLPSPSRAGVRGVLSGVRRGRVTGVPASRSEGSVRGGGWYKVVF